MHAPISHLFAFRVFVFYFREFRVMDCTPQRIPYTKPKYNQKKFNKGKTG